MRALRSFALVFSSVVIALASSGQASAQTSVVTFGGDVVTKDQDLNGAGSQLTLTGVNTNATSRDNRLIVATDNLNDDAIAGLPFNSTVQLSPTSGYTGLKFYGGASKAILGTAITNGFDVLQIKNSGTADQLDVRIQDPSTQHSMWFGLFFQKADFLGNGSSGLNSVTFGATSSLHILFGNATSSQISAFGEYRWIVHSHGQYYVSAQNSAGQPNIRAGNDSGSGINNNLDFTDTFASGKLTYWAPYNPNDNGGASGLLSTNFEPSYTTPAKPSFTIDPGTNPFVAMTFDDIDQIGFYIEDDQFATNVIQFRVAQLDFIMDVKAVPEPMTIGLIGVAGGGALWYGYRRRRQKHLALEESRAELSEFVAVPVPKKKPAAEG